MAVLQGYLGSFKIASDVATTASAEVVGTGDASNLVFYLDNTMIDWDNVAVELSDIVSDYSAITQVKGVDYEVSPRGVITFTSAPSDSRNVKATYDYFAGYTTLGGFYNWSIDLTADALESTDFDSTGWRTFTAGLKGWTGSAERYWASGSEDMMTLYMVSTPKLAVLQFFTENETGSDYYTGWGYITGFSMNVPLRKKIVL